MAELFLPPAYVRRDSLAKVLWLFETMETPVHFPVLRTGAAWLTAVMAAALVAGSVGNAPAAVVAAQAGRPVGITTARITTAGLGGRITSVVMAGGASEYLASPGRLPAGRTVDWAGRADDQIGQTGRDVLTIAVTGLNGKPAAQSLVEVGNVADENMGGLNVTSHGIARFHVGPGTYHALAVIPVPGRHGRRATSLRIDVLPQFTVAGNTTVQARAAAATSPFSVVTPRPAHANYFGVTIVRTAPHAPAEALSPLLDSFSLSTSVPIYLSPVRHKPADGTLRLFAWTQLTSPPSARVPYAYTLDFANPIGTIQARQRYIVRPGGLAVVNERYYQDQRSNGCSLDFYGTAYQRATSFLSGVCLPMRLPTRQVQYISATPPLHVQSQYYEYTGAEFGRSRPGQTPGGQSSSGLLLRPGQQVVQSWNQYPLHPAPVMKPAGPNSSPVGPSATRTGNTLWLVLIPFSDNQAGHTGDGLAVPTPGHPNQVSGNYALYQGGKKIAGGDAVKAPTRFGDLLVRARLSSRPSVLRLVLNASRASRFYHLSATSRDVWTWHTRRGPGTILPAPWVCPFTRRCLAQPLITLDYSLPGLALDGSNHPGRQQLTVTATHMPPASPGPVTSATAQVSLDKGRTWRPVQVRTLGHGRFRLVFAAPPGALVSLRVTATDSAGNSLAETIVNAYRTTR